MKYPKLTLLLGTFVAAYLLHQAGAFQPLERILNGHGYWSMLLAGMLFSFGFTTAFGVAIMVDMAAQVDPVLGALAGGVGAMLSDIGIFSLIRFEIFRDEVHRLRLSRLVQSLHALLHHPTVSERLRRMIFWSFAGLIIASPLPDEFGVTLVSSVSRVRSRDFAILCFFLNTIGILAILVGARLLAF